MLGGAQNASSCRMPLKVSDVSFYCNVWVVGTSRKSRIRPKQNDAHGNLNDKAAS